MADLPELTFTPLALRGVLCPVGVCYDLWQMLPYHLTIWHVFVLTGSMLVDGAILTAINA